jgi:ABC-type multidrug transport system ATPase subunit
MKTDIGKPAGETFYIRQSGRILGPFTSQKIQLVQSRGSIDPTAEWSRDRTTWLPFEQFPSHRLSPAPALEPAIWKYSVAGDQAGPVTLNALAAMISSGQISASALVWKPGDAHWIPVGQVPELAGLVRSRPATSFSPMSSLADTASISAVGSTTATWPASQRRSAPVNTVSGANQYAIQARGIAAIAGQRCLLNDVSLTIQPGELCGLMGPSGAGKSTLMNALNGYNRPSRGQVLVNGIDLYEHFDSFRGLIGFVPQDDIIHEDLTVNEALFYSARLRLPDTIDNAEIHRRIDRILSQLGLSGAGDVLIGSPTKKGISGGQRKRVNLAMELLTDPAILFLDEPTSGLSSEDTLIVLHVLRDLARSGKTILLTIHQPSLEAFRLLDLIAIVAKDPDSRDPGCLAYFGPAWPDSICFFNPQITRESALATGASPDLLLRGLKTRPSSQWCETYRQSNHFASFVTRRNSTTVAAVLPAKARTSPAIQFQTLLRRALSIKRRDVTNTAILLAQAPIIALLIVMVFGNKTAATDVAEKWPASAHAASITMFLMSLSAIWFGCSNSVREIVGELPIYIRERMITLSLACYAAAKFTFLGVLCVLQCTLLLGIVYVGCKLEGDWWPMLGVLSLASICGVSIGLTISAIAKSSEVAIAALPLVLLPMVILGGVLRPQHEMTPSIRPFATLMPSRWAFEGVILIESRARPLGPEALKVSAQPPNSGDPSDPSNSTSLPFLSRQRQVDVAEQYFPAKKHRSGITAATFYLLISTLVFLFATVASLRWRDVH